jgi:hypothetical protein
MSFFGLKIQPFKGKASFQPGKMNLGDLVSSAATVASGGIGGIGNVSKYSLGNIGTNIGLNSKSSIGSFVRGLTPEKVGNIINMGSSLGVGSPGAKPKTPAQNSPNSQLEALAQMLGQLGQSQTQFAQANEPRRQQAVMGAYNAVDPSMISQEVARNRASMMGAASDAGNRAMAMGGQYAQPGMMLDSLNRGTAQANTYAANAGSAEEIARRKLMQSQMFGAPAGQDGMSALLSLISSMNNQTAVNNANRKPTLLESLLPIAGQVLPYLKK